MKKDWDYVEFADYRSDMDELAATAANVSAYQQDKIDKLEMLVNALVLAAGGRIVVQRSHLIDAMDAEWVRSWRLPWLGYFSGSIGRSTAPNGGCLFSTYSLALVGSW